MPAVPPHLTPEQRRKALEKAAQVRKKRALIKQEVRDGKLTFVGVLERAEQEQDIAGIKVLSVLECVPGIGKVKSRRKLAELGISEIRRVKGLSVRQKEALLAIFKDEE